MTSLTQPYSCARQHPRLGVTSFADLVNASIAPIAFVTFGSQVGQGRLGDWIRWPVTDYSCTPQSDCRQVWGDVLKMPFSIMHKLRKRTFSPRQQETTCPFEDSDIRSFPTNEACIESKSSKDVAFSLSIDSSVTTESGDSRKPQLPILNTEQQPLTRPVPSRMRSAEEDPYDLDFFAALRST